MSSKVEKTDRISEFKVEMSSEDEVFHKLYVHTFTRDTQHILPYTHSSKEYHIEITPNSNEGLDFVANLFRPPRASIVLNVSEREFKHNIEEFVRYLSYQLTCWGKVYFEIVKLQLSSDDEQSSILWLARIHGQVYKKGNHYQQTIGTQNGFKSQSVKIPASKVWVVEIPKRFGGVEKHRQTIQRLAILSDVTPNFVSRGLQEGDLNRHFDLKSYSHNQFAQMAKLMQEWGWMLNQWRESETTEYYWIHRVLMFHASLAFLRQYIFDQMNVLLKQLEAPYQLCVKNVVDESDIIKCIEGLKNGTVSFDDAFELIYGR
jgi:hypothetical protein